MTTTLPTSGCGQLQVVGNLRTNVPGSFNSSLELLSAFSASSIVIKPSIHLGVVQSHNFLIFSLDNETATGYNQYHSLSNSSLPVSSPQPVMPLKTSKS